MDKLKKGKMTDKERNDYRRILNEIQTQYEEIFESTQCCAYKKVRYMIFRIGRVLAKHDRSSTRDEEMAYYKRPDILKLLRKPKAKNKSA